MEPEQYMKERLDDQIEWYDRKSSAHQRSFKLLRSLEILTAASIPVLASFSSDATPGLKYCAAVAGVIVVLVSGVLSLNKNQENWLQYRAMCEALQKQKYLYLTGAAPYSDPSSAFTQLVANVEALMSNQNRDWVEYTKKPPAKGKA